MVPPQNPPAEIPSLMDGPVDTLVIWNSHAGRVQEADEVRRQLEAEPGTRLITPEHARDAVAQVRTACQQGVRQVIAAGGDGTINSVINGMADAADDVVFGVLPLGTANDYCASLDVPDDLDAALDLIRHGTACRLDVAELHTSSQTKRFANIATGGNSHRVTESITSEQKQTWGAMCYLISGLSVLADLRSFETSVTWDDGSTSILPVWNLIVANGQTSAGRIRIAPNAKLNDGLLDVVVIEEGSVMDIAALTGRYLFDEYIQSGKVLYRQAKSIEVRSQPVIKFSIDGDLVDEEPIRFRVVPGALQTIVGPEAVCDV